MWKLDHKEGWVPSNCGVWEDSWESLGQQGDKTFNPKENQLWIFTGRLMLKLKFIVILSSCCTEAFFIIGCLSLCLTTFSDFMSVLSGVNNSLALFWLLQWLQGMSVSILLLSTCLFWLLVESLVGSIQVVMCFYQFYRSLSLIREFNLLTFKEITYKKEYFCHFVICFLCTVLVVLSFFLSQVPHYYILCESWFFVVKCFNSPFISFHVYAITVSFVVTFNSLDYI